MCTCIRCARVYYHYNMGQVKEGGGGFGLKHVINEARSGSPKQYSHRFRFGVGVTIMTFVMVSHIYKEFGFGQIRPVAIHKDVKDRNKNFSIQMRGRVNGITTQIHVCFIRE